MLDYCSPTFKIYKRETTTRGRRADATSLATTTSIDSWGRRLRSPARVASRQIKASRDNPTTLGLLCITNRTYTRTCVCVYSPYTYTCRGNCAENERFPFSAFPVSVFRCRAFDASARAFPVLNKTEKIVAKICAKIRIKPINNIYSDSPSLRKPVFQMFWPSKFKKKSRFLLTK